MLSRQSVYMRVRGIDPRKYKKETTWYRHKKATKVLTNPGECAVSVSTTPVTNPNGSYI